MTVLQFRYKFPSCHLISVTAWRGEPRAESCTMTTTWQLVLQNRIKKIKSCSGWLELHYVWFECFNPLDTPSFYSQASWWWKCNYTGLGMMTVDQPTSNCPGQWRKIEAEQTMPQNTHRIFSSAVPKWLTAAEMLRRATRREKHAPDCQDSSSALGDLSMTLQETVRTKGAITGWFLNNGWSCAGEKKSLFLFFFFLPFLVTYHMHAS